MYNKTKMKNILIAILLLISVSLCAQIEVIDYGIPTEKGDVECVLITKKGFAQLLEILELQDEVKTQVERAFLLENATSADYVAKRYNKTNGNKNGFSTIEAATVLFDIPDLLVRKENGTYLKEIDIAEIIYAEIQRLRA